MGIEVVIWTGHIAASDPGYQFSFTDNDPDIEAFIGSWLKNPAFDRMELWRDEGAPWVITDPDGSILDRFSDEQERDEALLTGEYPADAEPAYVNDPGSL